MHISSSVFAADEAELINITFQVSLWTLRKMQWILACCQVRWEQKGSVWEIPFPEQRFISPCQNILYLISQTTFRVRDKFRKK